jgi:integrase
MDCGLFLDRSEAERNTLGDLIERYLLEVTPLKRGAAPEASRLKAIQRRTISKYKISALSGAHVARYRDERLHEVSSGTVNKELNLLRHVIEIARREWSVALPNNPVRMVRRPAPARARDRRLVGDEEKRLLVACVNARNPFLLVIVQLALETAMRQSEIVGLEWRHIDLEKRVATLLTTKNGESRAVPLSSRATELLRSLYLAADSSRERVFPGVTAEAVKRAFIRACARAKIENFRFHDLRHEATSRLFELRLNPMEVASITGHKTLQMLMRYTHLRAEDLAQRLG